jgi:hypothetical protein
MQKFFNSRNVRFRPEILKFLKRRKFQLGITHEKYGFGRKLLNFLKRRKFLHLTRISYHNFSRQKFFNSRNVRFRPEILKFLKRRKFQLGITHERYGFGRKLLNFLKRRKFLHLTRIS